MRRRKKKVLQALKLHQKPNQKEDGQTAGITQQQQELPPRMNPKKGRNPPPAASTSSLPFLATTFDKLQPTSASAPFPVLVNKLKKGYRKFAFFPALLLLFLHQVPVAKGNPSSIIIFVILHQAFYGFCSILQ